MLKKLIATVFISALTCVTALAADTTGEVWLNRSVLTVDQNEYLDDRENLKLNFKFNDFNTQSLGNTRIFYEKSSEVYVLLTGATWDEDTMKGMKLGSNAYVAEVEDSYLCLVIRASGYLDHLNFELPLYCHVNSLGEIRAEVEGAIEGSVLIANSTDGDISITLGRQDMGTQGSLKPLTLTDNSTVHYDEGDEIRLELNTGFIFTKTPTLTGTGKFKDTCEFVIDDTNPSVAYIRFTKDTPDTNGSLTVENMTVSRPSGRAYKVASLKLTFKSGAVDISRSFPVAYYVEDAQSSVETTTEGTTEAAEVTTLRTVEIPIGESYYRVNGNTYEMDVPALINGGYTYLPLRYAANAAGIDNRHIIYYSKDKSAVIRTTNGEIQLTSGSNVMFVDGRAVVMDAPALIMENRLYLPMRALAEALEADNINYDSGSRLVTIIF